MDFHLTVGGMAIILAILTHAAAWVWFASQIAAKVDSLVSAIMRLEKDLETRDKRIDRAFDRIDEVRDMIPKV